MILQLFAIFIAFALYWHLEDKRKHKGFPPGPPRFPVIGCLPAFFGKAPEPSRTFKNLAKKYGDVMYISVGNLKAVVVHSYDAIVELLSDEGSSDRGGLQNPVLYDRQGGKNLGVLLGDGEHWVELRKFTIRSMRDFGLGKSEMMESMIYEELAKFMKHIDSLLKSSPDGVLSFDGFFEMNITNILWRLVTGKSYELDDPRMKYLLKLHNEFIHSASFGTDIGGMFPKLRDIFPKFFYRDEARRAVKALTEFAREEIRRHRAKGTYKSDPKGFIDSFLQKIDEHEGIPDSPYSDDHLCLTIIDLFQAGSDTTSKTMEFAILYMVLNPEVLQKVQKEIDSVLPDPDEQITLSHKSKLPYSYATLLEIQRYCSMVPIPPNRAASEDFYFQGYFIPKGTILFTNIKDAHFDERIWGDPQNFRPERFIMPNGSVDFKLAEYVIPFGYGKRICLGKALAEVELFLLFTTLCRKYNFLRAPNKPEPSLEQIVGFTHGPKPYYARVVKRGVQNSAT